MEGKVFLYSNGTPPRIAISTAFTFDLQRFAPTETTTTLKKAESDSVPDNALFSFKSGNDTWYSTSSSDFTTANLSGATEIKILGDITLAANVDVNLGTTITNVITVDANAMLALGEYELKIKRTGSGTITLNDNSYTNPVSAIVVNNGKSFTVTGGTNGKINYEWDPSSTLSKIKKARTSAAVQVGNKVGKYDNDLSTTPRATFNMTSGNITSKSTAISMSDNAVVNISGGTTESTKSCGIYYGNQSHGGGKINISGGTLSTGTESQLPALQISGQIANVNNKTYGGTSAIPAEIKITGGTIEYKGENNLTETTAADGKITYSITTDCNPDAIYAGGNTKLNIEGGTITSTGTAVEIRAGELTVTGGTIESTSDKYVTENKSGGSTYGAGIAMSQHSTIQDVKSDISGSDTKIKGNVAFAIENPRDNKNNTSKIEAEIDGGTFESTGTDVAAIAAKAADTRSKININGAVTFKGNIESTTIADTAADTPTITFGEDANVTVVTKKTIVNDDGTTTVVEEEQKYDSTSIQYTETWTETVEGKEVTKTQTYPVNDKTWTASKENPNSKFFYLVANADSKVAGAKAILAPKKVSESGSETDSGDTLAITTELQDAYEDVISVDLDDTVFNVIPSTFKTIDASEITTANLVKLNIIGNDKITSILGSAGNDTLKAGSAGAVLSGGKGNNLLQGGDGEDTFIHTAGTKATQSIAAAPNHDTIDNYKIADDIVSLTNELPTDLANGISYNNTLSEFVISLGGGAGDSLTFHSASEIKFKRYTGTGDDDTYYYGADRVIKNDAEATLGAAFSDKTFDLNKLSSDYVDYSKVAVIDASEVTVSGGLNIIANTVSSSATNFITSARTGGTVTGGNNGNTLISAATGEASLTFRGGEGNDSLVGGGSSKDLFIYTGGVDSISGYASGTDVVRVNNTYRLAEATVAVGDKGANNKADITLTFDNANSLIFEGIGSDEEVRVQQGTNNNYYTYAQQYSAHNNSITLASGYNAIDAANNVAFNGADTQYENYETINAAAVSSEISIVGNDNANYIFGPTAVNASIYGGANNDKINVSDRSSIASYLFEYTAGKDEIIGFDATKDTVDIAVENITAAKASSGKLALTVDKKNDVLTLRSEDEIEKVSLQSGGYLTKDGYVSGQGFSLFGSARGAIDLKDALYAGSSISLVAADSVKSQGVTLTGGAEGGTFIYATGNKKRDGFIYGGGAVSISGYEVGRDRIDLNAASLTSFEVKDTKEVVLKVGEGTISISGAAGEEVLLRDTSKGNGYKKMVFAQTGVIENKAKNPTIVTVSGAAGGDGDGDVKSYTANDSIKKIFVTGVDNAISIQAGNRNNTQIDASAAGKAVSLSGGAKNDKLIGSSENDLFVYSAGKDVLQGYGEVDSISISSGLASSLGSAKITAGSKSIKFQFTNKNTLTIKANSGDTLSNELTINETTQTYAKNAIESGGQATLTSAFSGTFNTASTKGIDGAVSTVNGAAVSRNLTYKGSTSAESLVGGMRKTTFKGGGGNDTLVGGSGKDIFFYAKGEQGTTKIADFDFGTNGRAGNDKLKIASGTISEITKAEDGKAIQFAMNTGKNTANVGWFQVTSGKDNPVIDATKVAIKANNTYYWFATEAGEDVNGNAVEIGQLITSDSRVSASDVSSYSVIDLNYSTNLAKAGVAVKVANAKPTT